MGLIYDDCVNLVSYFLDTFNKITRAGQVRMVVNDKVAKMSQYIRQILSELGFPYIFSGSFRNNQSNSFAFKEQPLNDHQSNERFSETNAITQQRTVIAAGDAY